MFDLILTFFAAYLIDNLVDFKNKKIYYLSILPLAVISHLAIGQKTFVNSQLFSSELNIVKLAFLLMILAIIYFIVPSQRGHFVLGVKHRV